jgi:hypothetical protein
VCVCAPCACVMCVRACVRVRVRVRDRMLPTFVWSRSCPGCSCGQSSFSVWMQFTVPTRKRSEHPRGMPLVTRMLVSSEQARVLIASASVIFCRKPSTVRQPQPDAANSTTAESMVKNEHRTHPTRTCASTSPSVPADGLRCGAVMR